MEKLMARISEATEDTIPAYLAEWAQEKINQDQEAHSTGGAVTKPLHTKTVNRMAKQFRKEDTVVWHCITCGKCFASPKQVRVYLLGNRGHIYRLKDLKKEVTKAIILRNKAKELKEESAELAAALLLLRVGIALKVATLVRLVGSEMFNEKVTRIVGDL